MNVAHYEDVEQTYTVNVPYTEEVQATRKVTKCVPETATKTVTVCGGHWETTDGGSRLRRL